MQHGRFCRWHVVNPLRGKSGHNVLGALTSKTAAEQYVFDSLRG